MHPDFHATRPGGPIEASIRKLDLADRLVIDLGYGRGDLAALTLAAGAGCVYGIEIDEHPEPTDPRIVVHRVDLTQVMVLPNDACVVMAPPYSLIAHVFAMTAFYENVWSLCPTGALDLAASYELHEVGCVDGDAFDPPSTGKHHIVVRGPFARGLL